MRKKLMVVFFRLMALFPLMMTQGLGWLLGRLFYWIPNKQRHYAWVNLNLCFPEYTHEQRRLLLKSSLVESVRLLLEIPSAWFRSSEKWLSLMDAEVGSQQIKALLAEGNGLIIAAPHLGNWEAGVHLLTTLGSLTALYRPPRQAILREIMDIGRAKNGATMVPISARGIKSLYGALKAGEMVAVLPDQQPKNKAGSNGVFAPFFGHSALTMNLINRLAKKTGAPVLFCFSERLAYAKGYKLHVVPCADGIASQDAMLAAKVLNQGVEACVRKCPTQYQWSYKRFDANEEGISPYNQIDT